MPKALTDPSCSPQFLVGVLASPIQHQAQFFVCLTSACVGQDLPAVDAYSARLRRREGHSAIHLVPCRCQCTAPPVTHMGQTLPTVEGRRVTLQTSERDAAAAPEGIEACVAQAVASTIRRR